MKHRNDYPEKDLRTAKQWLKLKKKPCEGKTGVILWSNHMHNEQFCYFEEAEVRDMTDEELEQYRTEQSEKRALRKEERKRRIQEERAAEIAYYKNEIERARALGYMEGRHQIGKELCERALRREVVNYINKGGIVCFDTETTGLEQGRDEIIKYSAIDGQGNVLLDTYIKPYAHKEWPSAERINNITPEMVKDAPYMHEVVGKIRDILESSETIVAYNFDFDMCMLSEYGIAITGKKVVDVMEDFAELYGDFNENYQTYTWKNLGICAAYYGYEFKAHDSLEDAKATLYCYKRMQENK